MSRMLVGSVGGPITIDCYQIIITLAAPITPGTHPQFNYSIIHIWSTRLLYFQCCYQTVPWSHFYPTRESGM